MVSASGHSRSAHRGLSRLTPTVVVQGDSFAPDGDAYLPIRQDWHPLRDCFDGHLDVYPYREACLGGLSGLKVRAIN